MSFQGSLSFQPVYYISVQNYQNNNHYQRKKTTDKHTGSQILTSFLRNHTYQTRAKSSAKIPGHRKQCKQRCTAIRQTRRCNADRSWPHNSNRKTAQYTADILLRHLPETALMLPLYHGHSLKLPLLYERVLFLHQPRYVSSSRDTIGCPSLFDAFPDHACLLCSPRWRFL